MDAKNGTALLSNDENTYPKWMPACAGAAAAACVVGAVVATKLRAPVAVTTVLTAVALNCSAFAGMALASRKRS